MAQQASITSLKEAIRLHLEPDIIWSTLPALLDLIAHVGLLVKKLRHEVEQFRDQVEFRGIDQVSLTGICTECESVEGNIWRLSLELRELGLLAALSSTGTSLDRASRLITTYWPKDIFTGTDVDVKHSTILQKLYNRAMGAGSRQAFMESAQKADEMYKEEERARNASGGYDSRPSVRDEESEAEAAAAVLKVTDQVFEYIAITKGILAHYPSQTPRMSRRLDKRVKSEVASPVKIATVPPGFERRPESSRQESKSIRVRDESIAGSDTSGARQQTSSSRKQAIPPLPREQVKVEHETPTPARHSSSARVHKETPPIIKVKKRSRPSFPPREGPNYMAIPTASASVEKQRLQPFQSRDSRR